METEQIRRLVIADDGGSCVGMVALGDTALQLQTDRSGHVLQQVSAQAP